MKSVLLFFTLLVSSGCALPNVAQSDSNNTNNQIVQPTPTANNANTKVNPPVVEMSAKVDETERAELDALNDKFRQSPAAFGNINFRDFSFPYQFYGAAKEMTFSLKNEDQYDYDFRDDRGWIAFEDVFYVDLTGDNQPEAIVMLWKVGCGGSCDGGSGLYYVYTLRKSQPKLIWRFETGSTAYGPGLKSFRVKNKIISVEEFGKCPDTKFGEYSGCNNKFGAKDVIHLTFAFDGRRIIQKSKTVETTSAMDVKNYPSEISIDN